MGNIQQNTKVIRVLDAVVAGTDDTNDSTAVDMSGYEGVLFLASFGALTASQVTSMKAAQGLTSGGSFADLLDTKVGPLADGDGNKVLSLDIYRPRERFVRVTITRATANAVIDGVVAILYGPKKAKPAKDASVAFEEAHQSPAEGTA
jgi:hypothetical protein